MLLNFDKANACKTNSVLQVDEQNQNGTYIFYAYKWPGGSGSLYKKNMRVTWNFGDGSTGTGSQITHQYQSMGRFNVTLYLWDTAKACGDTLNNSLCYFHPRPVPILSKSNDSIFAHVDTCRNNYRYTWIFDDNTYAYGCSVKHKYQRRGFFKPELTFIEDTVAGCKDTLEGINFKIFDFTRCGFQTDFTVTSGGGSLRYVFAQPLGAYEKVKTKNGSTKWVWGDGNTTSYNLIPFGEYKSHSYTLPGTYNLCYIITDSAGSCRDTTCKAVKIDSCQVHVDFTYTISDKTVFFNAQTDGTGVFWTFNGGSGFVNTFNTYANYINYGTYQVCLEASKNNCSKTKCKSITLLNCNLVSNPTYAIDTGNCLNVQFAHSSTTGPIKYKWDFGDTTFSNLKFPSHTYNRKGWKTAKLWAMDTINNCRDSTFFAVGVLCNDCKINDSLVLYYDSTKPFQANLYNFSTGPIHKHFWDFGDGYTSTQASPVHTYSITGFILLTYAATDTIKGCTDTIRIYFTIDSSGNLKRGLFTLNVITPGQTTGIQWVENLPRFLLFPNPFNGNLMISGEQLQDIRSIVMVDALGREMALNFEIKDGLCLIVLPSEIEPGIYLFKIAGAGYSIVYKLAKE